jgi:hypothetical protein
MNIKIKLASALARIFVSLPAAFKDQTMLRIFKHDKILNGKYHDPEKSKKLLASLVALSATRTESGELREFLQMIELLHGRKVELRRICPARRGAVFRRDAGIFV